MLINNKHIIKYNLGLIFVLSLSLNFYHHRPVTHETSGRFMLLVLSRYYIGTFLVLVHVLTLPSDCFHLHLFSNLPAHLFSAGHSGPQCVHRPHFPRFGCQICQRCFMPLCQAISINKPTCLLVPGVPASTL